MNNLAISIDEKRLVLKLMFIKNKVVTYKELNFDNNCLSENSVNYEKVFTQTLTPFLSNHKERFSLIVYVLQNRFAICDYLKIPSALRKKKDQTLNREISNRYNQSELFASAFSCISNEKSKAAFAAFLISRKTIHEVTEALRSYKLPSKVTFEAACVASTFHEFKNNHESILLADVKNDRVKLTLFKNNLIGFSDLITTNCSNLPYILQEVCDNLAVKYGIENIIVKIKIDKLNPLQQSFVNFDFIDMKNETITNNIELYGALNLSRTQKGLLF